MASEGAIVTRYPEGRLRSSSAKRLVRWEPASLLAKRTRRAGSWSRRFVACTASAGIVIVMKRPITTSRPMKTMAMPRPR